MIPQSYRTRYLDLSDMRQLVSEFGLIPMIDRITQELRKDFARWNEFQKSARTANHSKLGVVELMPVSDDQFFSFKFVNGHPENYRLGLSTVMAFGALAEMKTGWPLLLCEMTILTAIRTAATSALAAQEMARKDSKVMAMIGNGAQSEFQILAFHNLLGIEEVRLYDIDSGATDKLLRNLEDIQGLRMIRCAGTAEAVKGADIVTTCTADKKNATILTADMIEPGMHINGIGGDCPGKTELDARILEQAKVVCEYLPQSRIEGEIQQMPEDFQATELWEVLTGRTKGRDNESQITVFDSVGFSLEDFSSLRVVYEEAEKRDLGTLIDLVPQMQNCKDVFGLLQNPKPARR